MPFNFKKLLKRDNFSGHLNYSPPEMIQEKANFTEKVDIWSLGCCIYYIVAKKDPFDGKTPYETKQNILNLQFFKQMKIKRYCQEKVDDHLVSQILMDTLSLKVFNRPSCCQIIKLIDYQQEQDQYILEANS